VQGATYYQSIGSRERLFDWQPFALFGTLAPVSIAYWEIIADKLSKAGWSWGWVSAVDSCGHTIWIADAHRDNGKRFVVHSEEKLAAFLELETAIKAKTYR
jgi:hypothetical protein